MSLHVISWCYLVRVLVEFCLLLTLDQHGRQGPETGDVIDVSNLNVVHDEKFVECCVCYIFVTLATNVFCDGCGGRFHAGVCKAVETFMGSRQRVGTTWVFRSKPPRVVQLTGIQSINAYGLLHI